MPYKHGHEFATVGGTRELQQQREQQQQERTKAATQTA